MARTGSAVWMTRRTWLMCALILSAILLAIDTGSWWFARDKLRRGVQAWAERQRAAGMATTSGEGTSGGWPLAATWRVPLRLGPYGVPGGLRVQAEPTLALSLLHPDRLLVTVNDVTLVAADGTELRASAPVWEADLRFAAPDQVRTRAIDLRLASAGRAVGVGALEAEIISGHDPRLILRATRIDLAAGGTGPPSAVGTLVSVFECDALAHGGLPPPAATAQASAQAWRDGGGEVEIAHAALSLDSLEASFEGRFGLNAALLPSGSGVLSARGLLPLLVTLSASGAIAPPVARAVRGVLSVMQSADGSVRLPVSVADGSVAVAGFPLLRLPPPRWAITPAR